MKRLVLAALGGLCLIAPALAQVPGNSMNIQAVCTQMGELARGLDQVVNERQLYNNSRDIWRRPRGCTFRSPYEVKPETVRFMGWYLTTPRLDKPQFWISIYHVEYKTTRRGLKILPGITIEQETRMFRPHGALRADRWRLPRGCEGQWTERPERYKRVRLYGTNRQGGLKHCEKPEYVGKGFRESR